MKKTLVAPAFVAGALLLASCGTTGTTGSVGNSILGTVGQGLISNMIGGGTTAATTGSAVASTTGSVIGNLLSGLLGGSLTLSQQSLLGTWNYEGPACVFESENLLAKAGGAVASAKIESELSTQLAKVGIKPGICTFTFNSDNTYTAQLGSRTISGNYQLDAKNKKMTLTYLGGLAKMNCQVALTGGKLNLLFESDKLLTLLKGVSALSGSTTIRTVSSLLSNYNGMHVGLQLTK